MKALKHFAFLSLSLLFAGFLSCGLIEDDEEKNPEPGIETISAKWESLGDGAISSIEFTESGIYIITVEEATGRSSGSNAMKIISGVYTLIGTYIDLDGFGSIEIIELEDDFMKCLIMQDGKPEVVFIARKAEEIASSQRTDLLCRTWMVTAVKHNGIPRDNTGARIATFTKAGTYFLIPNQGAIHTWKWVPGSNEKVLQYTHLYWEPSEGYVSDSGYATIEVLTSTHMRVSEIFDDDDLHVTELEVMERVDRIYFPEPEPEPNPEIPGELIGTWKITANDYHYTENCGGEIWEESGKAKEEDLDETHITFRANFTYLIRSISDSEGTWAVSGSTLTLTDKNASEYGYEIKELSSARLVLYGENISTEGGCSYSINETLTFRKTTEPKSMAVEPELRNTPTGKIAIQSLPHAPSGKQIRRIGKGGKTASGLFH